ncbi:hypothetical protein [Pseudomonas sp. NW5]|uniref:hypothetical protein n=1 Tax=Pseudomonas sp. NW5 TaxID=2934934 RepID=UPI0020210395|nr:hypothetical protein [Pseudomonas sp. NW5]MCL7461216.1 hypothetical protein [Pseudomonas sp. NW5]
MNVMIPAALLLLLSGCMSYDLARVGEQGETVRAVQYSQIVDQPRAADPGTELSPAGTDGPLTENVINAYRAAKGEARQVSKPIEIRVND